MNKDLQKFLIKTNHESPVKLQLKLDGKDTDHYLMVLGSEAKRVQRAKIEWGVSAANCAKESEKIEGDVDRAEFNLASKDERNALYAAELVTDWSFGEFNKEDLITLLQANAETSDAVIACAYAHSEYVAKK